MAASLRQLAPENTDVLYTAYRIYSDLAGETMLSIGMVAANSAQMHRIMGQEMSRHGDIAGAIAHYREALKLDPGLPGLRFELAEALSLSTSPAESARYNWSRSPPPLTIASRWYIAGPAAPPKRKRSWTNSSA